MRRRDFDRLVARDLDYASEAGAHAWPWRYRQRLLIHDAGALAVATITLPHVAGVGVIEVQFTADRHGFSCSRVQGPWFQTRSEYRGRGWADRLIRDLRIYLSGLYGGLICCEKLDGD